MTVDAITWVLGAAIVAAAALRFLPTRRGSGRSLVACEVAYLRGGERAAAQTGIVELHLAGSVEATGTGGVLRTRVVPHESSAVGRAQYSALYSASHPLSLRTKPRVAAALGAVRTALERDGLLLPPARMGLLRLTLVAVPVLAVVQTGIGRGTVGDNVLLGLSLAFDAALWALPRRTVLGTRVLRRLRRNADPDATLMAVAVGGAPALRELLPRFTRDSGLLTKAPAETFELAGKETSRVSFGDYTNLGGGGGF